LFDKSSQSASINRDAVETTDPRNSTTIDKDFLYPKHKDIDRSGLVAARTPYEKRANDSNDSGSSIILATQDIAELSNTIADIEPADRDVPVLIIGRAGPGF
jgi:hypothetical protein